jgi:hypothetical protein
MNIKFDCSELVEFGTRLAESYGRETAIMTATQRIARVLHNHLLTNTPVDTGNLRKMWSAGENLAFMVLPTTLGYEVTLINTARADSEDGYIYATDVNDGNSRFIGRFFVERSMQQTLPQVEGIIMTELRRWWDSV